MNDELIAAAAFVREYQSTPKGLRPYHWQDGGYASACEILANAYITTLAKREGEQEPVTEDFIKELLPACGSPCPGSRMSGSYLRLNNRVMLQWIEWMNGDFCLSFCDRFLDYSKMTRGQVLSLLKALGIESKGVSQ